MKGAVGVSETKHVEKCNSLPNKAPPAMQNSRGLNRLFPQTHAMQSICAKDYGGIRAMR